MHRCRVIPLGFDSVGVASVAGLAHSAMVHSGKQTPMSERVLAPEIVGAPFRSEELDNTSGS